MQMTTNRPILMSMSTLVITLLLSTRLRRMIIGRSFAGRAHGRAAGANLPDEWSNTENVAWKTDIPARLVLADRVGNRVFLTTAVSAGKVEAPKKGYYIGSRGEDPRNWSGRCYALTWLPAKCCRIALCTRASPSDGSRKFLRPKRR